MNTQGRSLLKKIVYSTFHCNSHIAPEDLKIIENSISHGHLGWYLLLCEVSIWWGYPIHTRSSLFLGYVQRISVSLTRHTFNRIYCVGFAGIKIVDHASHWHRSRKEFKRAICWDFLTVWLRFCVWQPVVVYSIWACGVHNIPVSVHVLITDNLLIPSRHRPSPSDRFKSRKINPIC